MTLIVLHYPKVQSLKTYKNKKLKSKFKIMPVVNVLLFTITERLKRYPNNSNMLILFNIYSHFYVT